MRQVASSFFGSTRAALQVALATLREIFDEAAYQRFLANHGLTNSRPSYAAFLQENDRIRERRPRCC